MGANGTQGQALRQGKVSPRSPEVAGDGGSSEETINHHTLIGEAQGQGQSHKC